MSTKMLLHKFMGTAAAGGHANFFEPGTSTPKSTYTSTTYATAAAADVPISSDGWLKTYLLGDYDMDVFDKNGTQIPSASADGINPQAASVTNDPNLAVNGSFETDSDEDGTPDNWVLTEFAGSTNARVSSDQRHGAHCMSFTSTGNGGGYLTSSDFIAVNEDVKMNISFALKSSVAGVRNVVDILWFTEAEATVSTTSVYDEDTSNPTSWEHKVFQTTPPATARYAKIRLYGCHSSDSTTGTTLYDNVRFQPAEYTSVAEDLTNKTQIGVDNLNLNGNTISSTDTNGNINLTPNGTGAVALGDKTLSRPVVKDYGITYNNIGNSGSAFTVDLENGNVQEVTLTADATMTISNPPASGTFGGFRLIVNQDGTGNWTLTQPGTVETGGGTSLTVTTTANAKDALDYYTTDGGTSYTAAFYLKDIS